MRRLVSFLSWVLGGVCLGAAFTCSLFIYLDKWLPDHLQLEHYTPSLVTRLYTSDGIMLQEYAWEKRLFVPIEEIPPLIKNSFLAAEDRNFYHHSGIDFYGIARAILTNIVYLKQHKRPIGASTITQQVARNFLLSDELTFRRKMLEILLAIKINYTFTKDHLLELYLNEIYLGNGVYGVAAAAFQYYNKPLYALTLAEAAYLAALPKAPNHYDARRFPQRAKNRRNWVVQRLYEDGSITLAEMQRAMAQPLEISHSKGHQGFAAPYFAEEVRRQIIQKYGENALYKEGLVVQTSLTSHIQQIADRALREGVVQYDRRYGYRGPLFHVDLQLVNFQDPHSWKNILVEQDSIRLFEGWQLALVLSVTEKRAHIGLASGEKGVIPLSQMLWARPFIKTGPITHRLGNPIKRPSDLLKKGDVIIVKLINPKDTTFMLCQIPQVNGALVVMDPQSGRVLALSGGLNYENSKFNRATQALRQPGSLFKTFVYLAALQQGLTPETIIEDAPLCLTIGSTQWRPQNITKKFYGPCPLRVGLEKSRNLMTVRLIQLIGLDAVAQVSEQLGVMEKMPRHFSIALGTGETTLLKLMGGYSIILNGGKKVEPVLIDAIQDHHGRVIYTHDKRFFTTIDWWDLSKYPQLNDPRAQILEATHVASMTSMLRGVVERGTAQILRKISPHIVAKTGTTNDYMDAWCIAGTTPQPGQPQYIVGVYVGFDHPESLGEQETGGRVAAPIVGQCLQQILALENGNKVQQTAADLILALEEFNKEESLED